MAPQDFEVYEMKMSKNASCTDSQGERVDNAPVLGATALLAEK